MMAARPGLRWRSVTSSLTYKVPSHPVNMNIATRKPADRLPAPPIPSGLSHPRVNGTVPWRCVSTRTRPATPSPISSAYSMMAMPTWVRAVILMPTIAITSMMTATEVPMARFAGTLAESEPNTARTDGPRTATPLTVAITYAAIISQPVRKPR